jgi:hypothetical protein
MCSTIIDSVTNVTLTCGGNGWCVNDKCWCVDPYWGADCSSSMAWSSVEWRFARWFVFTLYGIASLWIGIRFLRLVISIIRAMHLLRSRDQGWTTATSGLALSCSRRSGLSEGGTRLMAVFLSLIASISGMLVMASMGNNKRIGYTVAQNLLFCCTMLGAWLMLRRLLIAASMDPSLRTVLKILDIATFLFGLFTIVIVIVMIILSGSDPNALPTRLSANTFATVVDLIWLIGLLVGLAASHRMLKRLLRPVPVHAVTLTSSSNSAAQTALSPNAGISAKPQKFTAQPQAPATSTQPITTPPSVAATRLPSPVAAATASSPVHHHHPSSPLPLGRSNATAHGGSNALVAPSPFMNAATAMSISAQNNTLLQTLWTLKASQAISWILFVTGIVQAITSIATLDQEAITTMYLVQLSLLCVALLLLVWMLTRTPRSAQASSIATVAAAAAAAVAVPAVMMSLPVPSVVHSSVEGPPAATAVAAGTDDVVVIGVPTLPNRIMIAR